MADIVLEDRELSIELEDREVAPIDVPKIKKEPKILNQLAAGVLDIGATLPGLPGLLQAAVEFPYRAATSDKPLLEDFTDSLDNKLMKLAGEGYKWSSEVTGAGEPETPGEQAARLASLLIPITAGTSIARGATAAARGVGMGAKAAEKTGKIVSGTANVLSPLVKLEKKAGAPLGGLLTKGNAARYGTQAGLAVGIDQAARDLAGMPTMFSDDSLPTMSAGTDSGIVLEDRPASGGIYLEERNQPASIEPSDLQKIQIEQSLLEQQRDLDKQLEDQESSATAKWVAAGVVALGAAYGAHRWRTYAAVKRMEPGQVAPAGVTPVKKNSFMSASDQVHAKLVDQNTVIEAALKDAGYNKEAREIAGQINVHTEDQFRAVAAEGKYTASGPNEKNFVIELPVSLNDWSRQSRVLEATEFPELGGMTTRDALGQYYAYKYERSNRIRATGNKYLGGEAGIEGRSLDEIESGLSAMNVPREQYVKTGLFDETGRLRENEDIFAKGTIEVIDALPADHPLRVHIEHSKKLADFPLQMLEKRGIITKEMADKFRKQFSMGDDLHYIPGKEALGSPTHRLGQWLGKIFRGTDDGKMIDELNNLQKQAMDAGQGITRPMDYVEALNQYVYSTLDFANRNQAKRNLLYLLDKTAVSLDDIMKGSKTPPRHAVKIGTQDPDTGTALPKFEENLPDDVAAHFEVHSTKPSASLIEKLAKDAIWIKEGGKSVLYYVPDKMLREAIRLQPRLYHTLNEVGRTFKNLYHSTTVRLPMFVPISSAYQVSQTTLNAIAHGVPFNPIKDTWRGIAESFAMKFAVEMSNQIEFGLKTNSGFFAKHPQLAAGFKKRMEKVIKDSVLMNIQREAGGFATSMGSHETYIGARDVMKLASPGWSSNYGTAGSLWRIYNYAMDSMREGAAAGLALRLTKERAAKEGKELRRVMADVRDIAGDIRRVGSSAVSETVQSWVPFSGPMIDAWNTIGIAAKKNPGRFAAAVGGAIVMPTLVESAYNNSLGEEYRDYYWNTLTQEQRINNSIWFIPGLPPERAILLPVTPEWSIARAVAIEAFDMLTGVSNIGEAGLTGENGSHFLAAIQRTFDIPVPSPIQAGFAWKKNVLKVGPQFPIGEAPGFYDIHPMAMGEQISGARGRSRYVDGVFDTEFDGVLKALIGGVASIYSGIAESFRQGKRTSTTEALNFGTEQAGREVAKQAKYLNPLFPMQRPTMNDDITDYVRVRKDGLNSLTKELDILMRGGKTISFNDPAPLFGNSLDPTNDPVFKDVVNWTEAAKFNIGVYEKEIAHARARLQDARSSSIYNGERLSRAQQAKVEDSLVSEIKAAKAKQLAELQRLEAAVSESLSQKYGREIDIDFSTFKARPNLPGGGK